MKGQLTRVTAGQWTITAMLQLFRPESAYVRMICGYPVPASSSACALWAFCGPGKLLPRSPRDAARDSSTSITLRGQLGERRPLACRSAGRFGSRRNRGADSGPPKHRRMICSTRMTSQAIVTSPNLLPD